MTVSTFSTLTFLLRFPLPHHGMRVTPPHLTRGIEWQLRYHDIGMYVATTHTSTIHTSTDESSKMSGIFWNLWQSTHNSPLKFNLMLGTIRLPKSGFKVLGSVASRMTITATILPTRVSSVIPAQIVLVLLHLGCTVVASTLALVAGHPLLISATHTN